MSEFAALQNARPARTSFAVPLLSTAEEEGDDEPAIQFDDLADHGQGHGNGDGDGDDNGVGELRRRRQSSRASERMTPRAAADTLKKLSKRRASNASRGSHETHYSSAASGIVFTRNEDGEPVVTFDVGLRASFNRRSAVWQRV